MKRIIAILLVMLCFAPAFWGQLVSNHKVVYYSPKSFHGHNQTWQAHQTSNGIMYFANGDGLLQYDGVDWKLTLTALHTNMLSLGIDQNERIYYGAIGEVGYFQANRDGELVAVQILNDEYTETMATEFYWDVHVFENKVVFRSEHVWVIYENEASTVIPMDDFIIKKSFKVEEYLWIQDEKSNLYKVHCDSLKYLSEQHILKGVSQSLKGVAIQGLKRYDDHKIIMTGAGITLKIYDEYNHSLDNFNSQLEGIDEPGFFLNELQVLPDKSIAVSSTSKGVFVLNSFGKITSVYNEASGLASNSVRNMFVDREGLMWITSDVGIYKVLSNKNYTLLTEQYQEVKGISNAIVEYDGQLVIATNENVFYIQNEDGLLKTYPLEGFNEQAFDLLEFDGELLCATTGGWYILDGQKFKIMDDSYARALVTVGPNHLLVGGRKQLFLWKKEGNAWSMKKTIDFPDEFLHFEKDPELPNTFWGGLYSSGMARVEVDTNLNTLVYKHFDPEINGHDGYILPFAVQNRMLFAPKIEEVYKYDKESEELVTDEFTEELIAEKFSSWLIKEDLYGNLFYEASGPVYFCRKEGNDYQVDSVSLANLNVGYINDIFCSETGETWLVAEENIVRFNPHIQKSDHAGLEVVLKKVVINSDSVLFEGYLAAGDSLLQQELVLPYESNNVTFDFVSAFHSDEDPLMYSYQLEGNDEGFSPWTTDRKAIYTNLPEGKYTFLVKSMNSRGTESEVYSFTFEILPPWYRTWLSYGLFLTVLGLLVFVIVKLNSMRLRKANDNLKKLVAEKTEEISSNLSKISHQRDQLEERNKDIIDSINYAQRLQNALLPSQEAIDAEFPRNFVLYLPKDIVAGDFYWLHAEQDRTYIAVADCTGHGVPGALVSVVCNDAMNQAANAFKLDQPDLVLNKVNDLVKNMFASSLGKGDDIEVRDGMDIALSHVNAQTREVVFAGAHNSLWILSDHDYSDKAKLLATEEGKSVYELKADRQPIGSSYLENPFTRWSIQLQKGDRIYMFTDGILDQFGGEAYGKIKKFKRKNLLSLLFATSNLSMEDQKVSIFDVFEKWKGEEEQLDDVTIIGIEL